MRPKRRYLGGNKGTEAPTSFLFFDSETHSSKPEPGTRSEDLALRLWCAIYVRREGQRFTKRAVFRGATCQEFWNVVESYSCKDRPLWAFAHNLGVDLTWLRFWETQLEPGHYTIGPVDRGVNDKGKRRRPWTGRLCLEGRPTFAFTHNRAGVVKWIDTGNYWPTSLYDIGKAHGIDKGKVDFKTATETELAEYCQRDCEVIEVAVCTLIRTWLAEKCGVFKPTAPGLAMTNFKHTMKARARGGETTAIVLEDDSPSRPAERESYYGGRIEPFYVGPVAEPVVLLDCVSLYPAMMDSNPFPVCRVESHKTMSVDQLRRSLAAYGAVARVRIAARGNTYPSRILGHQLHASGVFWTHLCGPELKRAVECGDVQEARDVHLYSMDWIFKGWVDYWFQRKVEAAKKGPTGQGDLEFAKLILNSLSGKFAQKGTGWQDRIGEVSPDAWGRWIGPDRLTGQMCKWRSVGWNAQCRVPTCEPAEAFPIISAFITAYSREYMRSIFAMLPPRSLYYTATDSLLVNLAGFRALVDAGQVDDEELGKFAIKRFSRTASIHGPNWWQIGDKAVRAGLHAKAIRGTDLVWRTVLWHQLPTILSQRPDGIVRLRETCLEAPRATQKGKVRADGWTEPKWFSEDPDFGDSIPIRRASPADPMDSGQTDWPAV